MSKKSRRQRRVNLPPQAFNTPEAAATASAPATRTAEARAIPMPAQRRVLDVNWREEYSEVLGDLKRTAILAVILLATMGVLSFIIH